MCRWFRLPQVGRWNRAALNSNVYCSLFTVPCYCLLFTVTVYCSLLLFTVTVYCSLLLFTVHCLLFTVHCLLLLFTVHCLLFTVTVYCSLFTVTVYCSLFTVYCSLFTVHSLLFHQRIKGWIYVPYPKCTANFRTHCTSPNALYFVNFVFRPMIMMPVLQICRLLPSLTAQTSGALSTFQQNWLSVQYRIASNRRVYTVFFFQASES
jgi:hypothetical protein